MVKSKIWTVLREKYPQTPLFPATEKEQLANPAHRDFVIEWREWMKTIFFKSNKALAATLMAHADLLERHDADLKELDVTDLVGELLAHVAAWEAVIYAWDKRDPHCKWLGIQPYTLHIHPLHYIFYLSLYIYIYIYLQIFVLFSECDMCMYVCVCVRCNSRRSQEHLSHPVPKYAKRSC